MTMHVGKAPGKPGGKGDHRCTPPEIWIAARAAIGIKQWDLDPATNKHATVPAATRWMGRSPEDDGLLLPWFGHVWLNPPFSKLGIWTQKFMQEARRATSLTFLGPGDSSTAWWQALARGCDSWAAWPRRQHFPIPDHPKGSPPGPVHLFYIGPRSTRWRQVMTHVGCEAFPGR